jgi:hypothetical protein
MRTRFVALGVTFCLQVAVFGGQAPLGLGAGQIMEHVGHYVDDYGARLAVIVATEHYYQHDRESKIDRTLISEIALVQVDGDWLGYRDVSEVDGRKVGDRTDRLQKVFSESPEKAIEQGRRLADESARYNVGRIQRNFNVPTTALFFLQTRNLSRFKFKLAGGVRRDERTLTKVTFEEVARPTTIRTATGRDVPVQGYVLVIPGSGAVVGTQLRIESFSSGSRLADRQMVFANPQGASLDRVPSHAQVTVSYSFESRFGLLLPVTMEESYSGEVWEPSGREDRPRSALVAVECRATYSEFKRFETSGRLVVPK